MFIALMLLMPYQMVGKEAHEWIGMIMFFLFICHHMMNQKWTRNINKGKYSFLRIWQIILVIFLFLFMLGSMISGIILSRYVFKSIRIMGVAVLMENVHMICAYWGFVMMALHLGFHWNMFINMIKNKTEKWKNSIWLVVRTLTYGIAIYGIFAFIKRKIGLYMTLKSHFVFFDPTETLRLYMLDYISMMILFVLVGYYIWKLDKNARYYTSTPELLKKYVQMVPPVDDQK